MQTTRAGQIVAVDDNLIDLESVSKVIKELGADWELDKTFTDPVEAITYIKASTPDVLLLDVEMGTINGFDVASNIRDLKIPIIFITNHDSFALKAFEFYAIDYILKPVTKERLAESLKKSALYSYNNFLSQFSLLKNFLHSQGENSYKINKIVLNNQQSIDLLEFEEIYWCEANGPYTIFNKKDGRQVVASKPMKYYEHLLEPYGFFRLHRSYIVNVSHVQNIDKINMTVKLVNGENLPVTPDRIGKFLDFYNLCINTDYARNNVKMGQDFR